jgi:hypothetical protein
MATGSPFPPVELPGSDKKYVVAECNNVSVIMRIRAEIEGFDLPRSWARYNPITSKSHDGHDDRCGSQATSFPGAC